MSNATTFTSVVAVLGSGCTIYGFCRAASPQNVGEKLYWEDSVKLLDVYGNRNSSIWEKLAEKYKDDSSKISGLTQLTEPTAEKPQTKGDQLKEKCKEILGTPLDADDVDQKENDAKRWCSPDSELLKESEASAVPGAIPGAIPGAVPGAIPGAIPGVVPGA